MTDDQVATLSRLAMILEAGQAENGIDRARQATYAEALKAALESRVLAERKEPECTCNSNPHAETCPVTAHVRTLLKESGETAWAKANGYAAVTNFGDPVLAHPTPDDARDDTKRLDLLISQEGLRIEKSSDGYVVWDCRNGLEIAGEGNTAREALDAAIDQAMQKDL